MDNLRSTLFYLPTPVLYLLRKATNKSTEKDKLYGSQFNGDGKKKKNYKSEGQKKINTGTLSNKRQIYF